MSLFWEDDTVESQPWSLVFVPLYLPQSGQTRRFGTSTTQLIGVVIDMLNVLMVDHRPV